MKAKIFLVMFGLLFGLVLVVLTAQFTPLFDILLPKGTSFNSLADLRASMLSGGAAPANGQFISMKEIVLPHPDDKIIYDLKPHLDITFVAAKTRTNSCGMRQEEVQLKKPKNTYRIAIIGDSFTFGWGVEENETFSHHLEKNLSQVYGGKLKFEVLNFGVPGYSTFQEVAAFKEKGIDFDPDAVIVFFVQNDFEFPFFVRDLDKGQGLIRGLEFVRILEKAADPKAEEEKLRMKGLDPSSSLKELSDLTRERGIKLFLAINPRKEWTSYLRRIQVMAERPDIVPMDMRDSVLEAAARWNIPQADLTLKNDPHPSAIRHKILAASMTPYFMDIASAKN